jgi:hypothetical protein
MIIYCVGNNWMSRQFIKEFEKKDFEYILNDIDETDNNLLSKIIEKNISHVIYFNNFLIEDELKDLELIDNLKNHLLIPNKIALFCQRYKIHFTYIGTGDIYNFKNTDKKRIPFNEEDEPNNFNNNFNSIRCCTDRLLKLTDTLNLRYRSPITSDLSDNNNYLKKILKSLKISNSQNSISVLDELIPLTIEMMVNKKIGTYNFTNPGIISENEILEIYKEFYDSNYYWNCLDDIKEKKYQKKKIKCHLDSSLLELNYNINPIKISIRKLLQNILINKNKNFITIK